MIEYIEREAAKQALGEAHFENYGNAIMVIMELSSADVKPVVFCKDCKKYKTKFCAIDIWTDQVTIYRATPYDYCSRGERGNDNEHID